MGETQTACQAVNHETKEVGSCGAEKILNFKNIFYKNIM
jgi:hypothetical protein